MNQPHNEVIAVTSALAGEANKKAGKKSSRAKGSSKPKIEKGHFFKELLKDLIGQSWTLLGLVVAYLVLEGSAKDLTGNLILVTLVVWILTFPIRYNKRENSKE